ncbi:MAG TPA: esterase-like activity of phytase family protein, partial [Mycobacterium sp.]
ALGFIYAAPLAPGAVFGDDKIIARYTLPFIAIKDFQNAVLPGSVTNDRKILLGSTGSDLWQGPNDPKDEFWLMTDRGPNGQVRINGANRRTFPIPTFSPMILRVKTEGETIRILETLPILGQSGKSVSGISNIKDYDETPYDVTGKNELPLNPSGIDPEGLVRTKAGEFWIVEEYSPSLMRLDRSGKVLKRYIPEGIKLAAADYPLVPAFSPIFGKRKINRGFEGLAISSDEKTLYIVLQSPLLNPDRKTGNNSRNTRVMVFDVASEKVTAEYVYRFDTAKEFDPDPKMKPNEMKLSAAAYVNPTTLLILERTDGVAKIFSVDLSTATNILNSKWNDPQTVPTLESLENPATENVAVLPKTLVVDLSKFENMPEKIEGLVILDRNTIAVANDNDFDTAENKYDADGNNIGKGTKNQVIVISLAKQLPPVVPAIASAATPTDGAK